MKRGDAAAGAVGGVSGAFHQVGEPEAVPFDQLEARRADQLEFAFLRPPVEQLLAGGGGVPETGVPRDGGHDAAAIMNNDIIR